MEPDKKRLRKASPVNDHEDEHESYQPDPKVQVPSDLYLDTIDRHRLDFDFEKVCSISLSNLNVYACLVCGKYFQGRGKSSHAYFHSMQRDHHVFINLHTLKVYVLPEDYEVKDSSLNDIKYVLDPIMTKEQVAQLDKNTKPSYDVNNKEYIPGFVGLNNIKANDYINVIIQALAHIPPIRDYFILEDFDKQGRSELVKQFGLLVRKMWNPRAFKGQVSPHEFLQAITSANSRFTLTEQCSLIEFFSWLLNTLHKDIGGSRKTNSSIIYRSFQGEVQVESQNVGMSDVTKTRGDIIVFNEDKDIERTLVPYLFLVLDLPAAPLYQDETDRNIIPQVPLSKILEKYDGMHVQEYANQKKRYHITRLPKYLIFHIKRFAKNNWFTDKNPTIVTFPIIDIDMATYTSDPSVKRVGSHYDLVANISHEGKPNKGEGSYKIHVQQRGTGKWYEIQDLLVGEIMPQMIFLSESYLQIWERKPKATPSKQ